MRHLDPVSLVVAVTLAIGGLATVALCWRRRALVAGLPALGSVALAGVAIWRALARRPAAAIVLLGLTALLIALALIVIGGAVWRLLETSPDDDEIG